MPAPTLIEKKEESKPAPAPIPTPAPIALPAPAAPASSVQIAEPGSPQDKMQETLSNIAEGEPHKKGILERIKEKE